LTAVKLAAYNAGIAIKGFMAAGGPLVLAIGAIVVAGIKLIEALDGISDALETQSAAEDQAFQMEQALFVMTTRHTAALENGTIPALQAQEERLIALAEAGYDVEDQLAEINPILDNYEAKLRAAAVAQLQLLMAMQETKGAGEDVLRVLQEQIKALSTSSIMAGNIDRGTSGGGTGTGSGAPPTEEIIKSQKIILEMEEQIKNSRIEAAQIRLDMDMEHQRIIEETSMSEMERAQQVSNIYLNGAMAFGRSLRNGGQDMLDIAVQIGIEFAKIQFGKSLGLLGNVGFSFLGGFF